jgi:hypothetical protein
MIGGSVMVIIKRHQDLAAYALFAVVVLQAFGYGLVFNMSFFLRNLSVIGGLLMVLSDSYTKRKQMFAALPQMSETDRREYFQLAGRILLIFLFIGSAFHGDWTFSRVLVSLIGLAAAISGLPFFLSCSCPFSMFSSITFGQHNIITFNVIS